MPCSHGSRRQFLKGGSCALAALSLCAVELAPFPGVVSVGASGQERRYPVPAADGVKVDRSAQVLLARDGGKAFALALACPHQNAAVKWLAKDHRFQCSKHDSQYQPNGTYTSGHATRNLDRFPIRREGAEIVVSLDRVFRSDENPAGWAAASVDV